MIDGESEIRFAVDQASSTSGTQPQVESHNFSRLERVVTNCFTSGELELSQAVREIIAMRFPELPMMGDGPSAPHLFLAALPDFAISADDVISHTRHSQHSAGGDRLARRSHLAEGADPSAGERTIRDYDPRSSPSAIITAAAEDHFHDASLGGDRSPDEAWVVSDHDPILRSFLLSSLVGTRDHLAFPEVSTHVPAINAALGWTLTALPAIGPLVQDATRVCLLFEHPSTPSFASLAAHGAIFVNCREVRNGDFAALFIEELAHQAAHVVLNVVTVNRELFFLSDPDQSLSDVGVAGDRRSVYEFFHGLFTEYVSGLSLASAATAVAATRETVVRLADVTERLERDSFVATSTHHLFTAEANALIHEMGEAVSELRSAIKKATVECL